MVSGRANGYAIEYDRQNYLVERRDKPCGYPGCSKLIRRVATYCRQHAQQMRHIEHGEQIESSIEPQYLEPTPPGMVLICYPRQALGGEDEVRRVVRQRLRRRFARKEERPAVQKKRIDPIVRAAWLELTK